MGEQLAGMALAEPVMLDGVLPGERAGGERVISQDFAGIGVQHLRVRTRRVADKSRITGLVLVSFAREPAQSG